MGYESSMIVLEMFTSHHLTWIMLLMMVMVES